MRPIKAANSKTVEPLRRRSRTPFFFETRTGSRAVSLVFAFACKSTQGLVRLMCNLKRNLQGLDFRENSFQAQRGSELGLAIGHIEVKRWKCLGSFLE